ncbi:uncharacterized protein LOC118242010 [Electrophorus electricus]|uniref:uncharacterized protein LOC118242010 n=1 Tax=Electrophorus electricus TaxID=8005 RepID=UPI0015D0B0E8|nr:uncharacterized protein LOC118242010 [Electrophorus electricus]
MASSCTHMLILHVLLYGFVFTSSSAEESTLFVSVSVGEVATIQCSPRHEPQDGVRVHKFMHKNQAVSYFYRDGTFTPKPPYNGRLDSNKNLSNFTLSIHNVTVRDSGVYWCTFNKEETESLSKERYLLVVSGKEIRCPERQGHLNHTLILVCVITAVSVFLSIITIILLSGIPKVKRCCERRNYTSTQQPSDSGSTHVQQPLNSEYEVMHAHQPYKLDLPSI